MNVLFGVVTMVSCLFLQALLVGAAIQYYGKHQEKIPDGTIVPSLLVIGGVMLLLLVGNFSQIAIWAALFQFLGEFEHFADAVYHSAVNFSTLGYGDIVMSEAHRMLGPMEAVNGVLMIGLSTAVLMAAFQDILQKRQNSRSS